MSRPLRIEYPGAYYHVMNRGLTGQAAFVTESDSRGFLALIEDAWRRWDIRVFSYCLMDTHDHTEQIMKMILSTSIQKKI
jgi:putative transposase